MKSRITYTPNKNYSIIPNYHLRDKRLSLKAMGLLSLIISLPENWQCSISGFTSMSNDGKDSVGNTIKELEKYGYLKREQIKENGKFAGFNYIVYDKPLVEKPLTENPITEKPLQINTNKVNIEELNTNKEKYKREKLNLVYDQPEEINEVEEWFEYFWKCYPKKVDKKGSYKAFKNIPHLNKELFHTIYTSLELHKRSAQWQNPQYIPNPTTWLHQARWETSIDVKSNKTTQWYDSYQEELEQKQQNKPKVDVDNLDDLSCFFNKK